MNQYTVHAEFSSTTVEANSPEEAIRSIWNGAVVEKRYPEVNDADRFWVTHPRFSRPVAMSVVRET